MAVLFFCLFLFSFLALLVSIILLFIKSVRRVGIRVLLSSIAVLVISFIGFGITSDSVEDLQNAAKSAGFVTVEEYKEAKKYNITTAEEWEKKKNEIEAQQAAEQKAQDEKLAAENAAKAAEQAKAAFYTPPKNQVDFISVIVGYRQKYLETSNPLGKTALRQERGKDVCKLVPEGHVKHWVGRITKIGTGLSDDATLTVQLSDKLTLQTIEETEITPANPLYYKLAKLEVGQQVQFEGAFLVDREDIDCLGELSLTEQGSMDEPEYDFSFKDIHVFNSDPAKLAEINADAEKKAEEARAAGAKEKLTEEECKTDLKCAGNQYWVSAESACKAPIEDLFKYRIKWTTGLITPMFNTYKWFDKEKKDMIIFFGDKIEAENGFGAWQKVQYYCVYNIYKDKVLHADLDR